MPCSSSSDYSYNPVQAKLDEIKEQIRANNSLKKELDRVTAFLCEILSENPKLANQNSELESWWKEHQKWDKKRENKKKAP